MKVVAAFFKASPQRACSLSRLSFTKSAFKRTWSCNSGHFSPKPFRSFGSSTRDSFHSEEEEDDLISRNQFESLAERMRFYESRTFPQTIEHSLPFILRLDGHSFSELTSPFQKPYDERVAKIMLKTAVDALLKYHPLAIYTASDEITLIFHNRGPLQVAFFGGRVQKMLSLVSGFCSARFNYHMFQLPLENLTPSIEKKARSGLWYFDARIATLSTEQECWDNILFRHYDTRRNSVSMLAQTLYSQKVLSGVNRKQQLAMIKEKGIEYDNFPPHYREGLLLKKKIIQKEAVNKITHEKVLADRKEIVVVPLDLILKNREEGSTILMAKHITREGFPTVFNQLLSLDHFI
jgi:tRNA(His) guanylyltransferase